MPVANFNLVMVTGFVCNWAVKTNYSFAKDKNHCSSHQCFKNEADCR